MASIAEDLAPDITETFRDAMNAAGLLYAGPIFPDGRLHRIRAEGDKRPNAWYVLHGDAIPAGAFGSWKAGITGTWRVNANLGRFDQARQRDRLQAAIRAARLERQQAAAEAAAEAARIWDKAGEADPNHLYLRNKHVGAHGIRQHGKFLVVPVRSIPGDLVSLQSISPSGRKKFLPGGKVGGGVHFVGERKGASVVVSEGYATACSVHQATGWQTVCCFNAGNLVTVARSLASVATRYWIAADNDHETRGNPGLTKAREAARILAGKAGRVLIKAPAPERGVTDWNDVHVQHGIEAVREAFR